MFSALPLVFHLLSPLCSASPQLEYATRRDVFVENWQKLNESDQTQVRLFLRTALSQPIFRHAGRQCLFDTIFLHALAGDMDSLNQAAIALPAATASDYRKWRKEFDKSAFIESLQNFTWPPSQLDIESQRLQVLRDMSQSYFLLGWELNKG